MVLALHLSYQPAENEQPANSCCCCCCCCCCCYCCCSCSYSCCCCFFFSNSSFYQSPIPYFINDILHSPTEKIIFISFQTHFINCTFLKSFFVSSFKNFLLIQHFIMFCLFTRFFCFVLFWCFVLFFLIYLFILFLLYFFFLYSSFSLGDFVSFSPEPVYLILL